MARPSRQRGVVRRAAFAVMLAALAAALFFRGWRMMRDEGEAFPDLHLGTQLIAADKTPVAPLRYGPGRRQSPTTNPHQQRIDEVIEDESVRAAIRAAQPACAAIGQGSGVCVHPSGLVLTNAHVAREIGARWLVAFPDGGQFVGACVALNRKWDLALIGAKMDATFPYARIADAPPRLGDPLICIGQPATMAPSGQPTQHQPFHVSTGRVLEVDDDPLGDQSRLGKVRHSAWTYWGHSGSPLFDARGRIVALHNSWDATDNQRHAVSWEAIRQFLREAGVE